MNEEKSREQHLKANDEDDVQILGQSGTADEVSTSNLIYEDNNESFEHTLLRMINKMLLQEPTVEYEVPWDTMKLLANFIGIEDYETNLFSGWVLKTIIQQIFQSINQIDEYDFKSFIFWLMDEIIIVKDSPDMSRENFFVLMNNVFHRALSAIIEGKGLLLLKDLIPQESSEEEMQTFSETSLLNSTDIIDSYKLSVIKNNEEVKTDANLSQISTSESEFKSDHFENVLHAIIEATYHIFGSELDYVLIQSAANQDENVLFYTIPYHFRKPRVVKKLEPIRKSSILSTNSKSEKPKKRRKSSLLKEKSIKEKTDNLESILAPNITCFDFLLPLSEAIESYEVIQSKINDERETETN